MSNEVKNGFYCNISNEAYHAGEGVSKSGLDKIERSPAHFKYSKYKGQTAAMMIGSAIHSAVLEPESFKREYVVCTAKDRRQKEYKDLVAEYGADFVLMANDADKVETMKSSIYGNDEAVQMLTSGNPSAEVSLYATDPITGVKCRCRFDLLNEHERYAVDLKKTQDASPAGFAKSVAQYRYHVQAAYYSDLYKWHTGNDLEAFYFLAVEEEYPHFNKLYVLTEESIEIGRIEYRQNLDEYAKCLKSDFWPKPCGGLEELSLPSWKINEFEQSLDVFIED